MHHTTSEEPLSARPSSVRGAPLFALLPPALLQNLDSRSKVQPKHWRSTGAVLSIDVSGSSALAERLGASESYGAEDLARHLTEVFDPLIAGIQRHGGEVEQFAGDNILAVWDNSERGLNANVQAAVACAGDIQAQWKELQSANSQPLQLRMGVGSGYIWRAIAGGASGRYFYLLGGAAVCRAQQVEDRAPVSGILLSDEVVARIEPVVQMAEGFCAQVRRSEPVLENLSATPVERSLSPEVLQSFLPNAVHDPAASGDRWLSEFRRVQIVFADLGAGDDSHVFDPRLDERISLIQESVSSTGGSILQFAIEHGQHTMLACWGLAGESYEDDVDRSLRSALALNSVLVSTGATGSVGVARGRVFCGYRGNASRREYAVIGSAVNQAARIMQRADGLVVCDEFSRAGSTVGCSFESSGTIKLRGFDKPVALHRVHSGRTPRGDVNAEGLLGRNEELQTLRAFIDRSEANEDRKVPGATMGIIIEGEAGIGKSTLLREIQNYVTSNHIVCLPCSGQSINRNEAYHAWPRFLETLVGLAPDASPSARVSAFAGLVSEVHDGLARLPLLVDLAHLEIPDSASTARLVGQARQDAIAELIVDILRSQSSRQRMVICCEDIHWFDSASMALICAVLRANLGLQVVLTRRPLEAELPEGVARTLDACDVLKLGQLNRVTAPALIGRAIGAAKVPDAVVSSIVEKAGGHPFFMQELAKGLVDAKQISVENGQCFVLDRFGDDSENSFPESIEGVITSRIDALPSRARLVLRVASVIGRRFDYSMLADIYPMREQLSLDSQEVDSTLSNLLEELVDRGLLDVSSSDGQFDYQFHHALICDCVYDGLVYAQRRELHKSTAEKIIQRTQGSQMPNALLAHHWFASEDVAQGSIYASLAGAEALRNGAYKEASEHYSLLLELLRSNATAMRDLNQKEQVAEWYQGLGESSYALGDFTGATPHFLESLSLLGAPAPRTRLQWLRVLAVNLLRQAGYRIRSPRRFRPELRHAALAAERLSERAYFARDQIALVGASLLGANLSTLAGERGDLSRSYSMLSVILCVGGFAGSSEKYHKLALNAADEVNDSRARVLAGYTRSVALSGRCEFTEARQLGEEALQRSRLLGNGEDTEMCLCSVGNVEFYTGRIDEADRVFQEVAESAESRSNGLHESWGLYAIARGRIARGHYKQAETPLRRALLLLEKDSEAVSVLICHGLLAELLFATNRFSEAYSEALKTLELIRTGPPTVLTEREGYAGAAAVFLGLWEKDLLGIGEVSSNLQQNAVEALKAMKRFASTFPLAEPRYLLLKGRYQFLKGRKRQARKTWLQASDTADRQEMPHEQALLERELGWRALENGEASDKIHRQRARELFDQLGCQLHGGTVPPPGMQDAETQPAPPTISRVSS